MNLSPLDESDLEPSSSGKSGEEPNSESGDLDDEKGASSSSATMRDLYTEYKAHMANGKPVSMIIDQYY